jgi:hypothetical protein
MSNELYYELRKLSGKGESWTFSNRQAAEDFLKSRLCKDCAQTLQNGGYADFDPASESYECYIVSNPLETDCGGEYSIVAVTRDEYVRRANQALDEIASLWRSEYEPVEPQTDTGEGAD